MKKLIMCLLSVSMMTGCTGPKTVITREEALAKHQVIEDKMNAYSEKGFSSKLKLSYVQTADIVSPVISVKTVTAIDFSAVLSVAETLSLKFEARMSVTAGEIEATVNFNGAIYVYNLATTEQKWIALDIKVQTSGTEDEEMKLRAPLPIEASMVSLFASRSDLYGFISPLLKATLVDPQVEAYTQNKKTYFNIGKSASEFVGGITGDAYIIFDEIGVFCGLSLDMIAISNIVVEGMTTNTSTGFAVEWNSFKTIETLEVPALDSFPIAELPTIPGLPGFTNK